MSCFKAYKSYWLNALNFSDRTSFKEYWLVFLVHLMIYGLVYSLLIASIIYIHGSGRLDVSNPYHLFFPVVLIKAYNLAIFIPDISISVRRFIDVGVSLKSITTIFVIYLLFDVLNAWVNISSLSNLLFIMKLCLILMTLFPKDFILKLKKRTEALRVIRSSK